MNYKIVAYFSDGEFYTLALFSDLKDARDFCEFKADNWHKHDICKFEIYNWDNRVLHTYEVQ